MLPLSSLLLTLLAASSKTRASKNAIDCSKYCVMTTDLSQFTTTVKCLGPNGVPLSRIPYECIPSNTTSLEMTWHSLRELPAKAFENLSVIVDLQLRHCEIDTIHPTAFQNLTNLHTLNLKSSNIREISVDHFKGLTRLFTLNLNGNQLTRLDDFTFVDACSLRIILLNDNPLESLGQNVFAGTQLDTLALRNTKLSSLPAIGISKMKEINVAKVPNLHEFPSQSAWPNIELLTLTYPSHCCQYKDAIQESLTLTPNDSLGSSSASINERRSPIAQQRCNQYENVEIQTPIPETLPPGFRESTHPPPQFVACSPQPDVFNSCQDIMGSWPLRIAVWLVIILNMCGNLTVIVSFVSAYRRFNAVRLLLTNMALADLCMGLYLFTIAVADAATYKKYANHAVEWKTGGGCAFAGFLSVFASELSLYTLVAITVERLYRLHYAMYAKRINMKQASVVVLIGWMFATLMALLPLVGGVSDYTVSAICLPFDIEGGGLGYVTFLLLVNGLAFLLILLAYVYLFYSVTGGQFRSRKQEASVFRRMALLVTVDFLCWCPIIIIGLVAAHGDVPISLGAAKVIMVFIYPLNACANPFLYAIFTRQFKRDFFEFWFVRCGLFETQYRKVLARSQPSVRRGTQTSRIGSSESRRGGGGGGGKRVRRPDRPSQWSMGTNLSMAPMSSKIDSEHSGTDVFDNSNHHHDNGGRKVNFTDVGHADV